MTKQLTISLLSIGLILLGNTFSWGQEPEMVLKGHSATVTSVAFTPDGKTLATGSRNHTIKFWDVATGKEKTTLKAEGEVWGLLFSPNGKGLYHSLKKKKSTESHRIISGNREVNNS